MTGDDLADLAGLMAQKARVEELIRDATRRAVDAGHQVTEIAAAAGVTRQTVYRWMDGTKRVRVDVREVLNDALGKMIGHVGEATTAQLCAGLASGQVDVKVRRYRLGVQNLAVERPDAELRAALAAASEVIDAAEAVHGRSGRWPTTVTLGTSPPDQD